MFSYYGSKSKLSKHYPSPLYDTIIEPFCGAAFYSLYGNNWKKNILLFDKYDVVIDLWKYLINANKTDILKLPILKYKESLDNYKQLIKEERYLIGFCINQGSAQPKKTRQKFCGWNERKRREIADNLYKIRHWKASLKDYKDISDFEATWMIDPPYQFGGKYYRHKNIDYSHLAEWCLERKGQLIVCENNKANWLTFTDLKTFYGQRHLTTEVVYIRN